MSNGLSVRVGTVNGSPIIVNIGAGVMGGNPTLVRVQLSADYTMENSAGYPFRPETGGATPFSPHTLANGTAHDFLKPEADALVAAGAANLV